MRPLEILIVTLLAAYLAWPFSRRPRPVWVTSLPALALIVTLAHFGVEGYRWQMIPLYGLTPLLALAGLIRLNQPRAGSFPSSALGSALTLILLAVSTALPILLPVPRLPKMSGPYQVGTRTFYMEDASRKELYSGEDGPRRFMIQVWYPADPRPDDKQGPWMNHAEIYAPSISDYLRLPHFFLDHLTLVKSPAYVGAPLHSAPAGGYPLISFSHGWNGFAAQNTGQMVELASHGYVVVSIEHTYGARITVFPDGTVAPNNPNALPEGKPEAEYDAAARQLVDQWTGDISFTLDFLASQNADAASPFSGALNLNRIGVYGHSTGGGAAIQFCGTDPRCKAVLGLDPFMTPVSLAVLDSGLKQPAFFMFSQAWADDADSKNSRLFRGFITHAPNSQGVVSIDGTRHYDFSDLPLLSPIAPQLGLKGPLDGKQVVKIVDTYLLAFFNSTLQGQPTGLFNGRFETFKEVQPLK